MPGVPSFTSLLLFLSLGRANCAQGVLPGFASSSGVPCWDKSSCSCVDYARAAPMSESGHIVGYTERESNTEVISEASLSLGTAQK